MTTNTKTCILLPESWVSTCGFSASDSSISYRSCSTSLFIAARLDCLLKMFSFPLSLFPSLWQWQNAKAPCLDQGQVCLDQHPVEKSMEFEESAEETILARFKRLLVWSRLRVVEAKHWIHQILSETLEDFLTEDCDHPLQRSLHLRSSSKHFWTFIGTVSTLRFIAM